MAQLPPFDAARSIVTMLGYRSLTMICHSHILGVVLLPPLPKKTLGRETLSPAFFLRASAPVCLADRVNQLSGRQTEGHRVWPGRNQRNQGLIMKNKTIAVWLSALTMPIVILIGAQVDATSGPSIGGGGYDLGPFLYSWLLVLVTAVWSLCALVAALLYRDRASSRQALVLAVIGIIALTLVLLFYRENLR